MVMVVVVVVVAGLSALRIALHMPAIRLSKYLVLGDHHPDLPSRPFDIFHLTPSFSFGCRQVACPTGP